MDCTGLNTRIQLGLALALLLQVSSRGQSITLGPGVLVSHQIQIKNIEAGDCPPQQTIDQTVSPNDPLPPISLACNSTLGPQFTLKFTSFQLSFDAQTSTGTFAQHGSGGIFALDQPLHLGLNIQATLTIGGSGNPALGKTWQLTLPTGFILFDSIAADACPIPSLPSAPGNATVTNAIQAPCSAKNVAIDVTTGPDGKFRYTATISIGGITFSAHNDNGFPYASWSMNVTSTYEFQPMSTANLVVDHMELVQAVQNPTNDAVPLVAKKGTVVRVFPKVASGSQFVEGVTGTMRGIKDGVELRSFSPVLPFNGPITALVDPKRDDEFSSLDFLLPIGWTDVGQLQLILDLHAPSGPNIQATLPNALEFRKAVNWPYPFFVAYLPVCYQPPGQDSPTCPTEAVRFRTEFLDKLYPVPDDGIDYFPLSVPPWLWTKPLTNRTEVQDLVGVLRRFYQFFDRTSTVLAFGGLDQLAAWVPWLPDLNLVGLSDPVWRGNVHRGRVVFLQDSSAAVSLIDAADSLAHEIGHNLGLYHPTEGTPGICGASGGFPGWPYPDGTINETGYDPEAKNVVPRIKNDFMGYCPAEDLWISPWNFDNLFFDAFVGIYAPKATVPAARKGTGQASAQAQPGTAGPMLIVSGTVQQDGSGASLLPAVSINNAGTPDTSDPNGNHCVRLIGDAGILSETCITLDFVEPEKGGSLSRQSFSILVPAATGTNRISLVRGGAELTSISAGPNPPAIQITSPQANSKSPAGQLVVQWTASDPDGDQLSFSVLYSPDGGNSFVPLVTDITDMQYSFDASKIDGGQQVYFRVLASDGIHTSSDTAGPLEVTQTPTLAASAINLDFRNVLLGQTGDLLLTLKNAGNGPLRITDFAADSPLFTLRSPVNPLIIPAGTELTVRVRFRPDSAGSQSATLMLHTNDPGNAAVLIPLAGKGIVTAVPDMQVTPAALAFGAVRIGQSSDLSLTVHNNGPGKLTVASLSSSAAQFQVISPTAPFTVAANADQKVTVRFSPAAAGPLTAALTIASDDPVNPSLRVPLSGTGAGTTGSCAYSLSVTSVNVPAGSSTITVGVTASDSTCAWTAVSNASWITISSGSPGTGNGRVSFSIAANPANSARTGTLTIAGIIFAVTQAAAASPSTAVVFSDSFQRPDTGPCLLGAADLALGGSGSHYYLPIFPGMNGPVGASIASSALQNNGLDFGGVQFTTFPSGCGPAGLGGGNLGQDLNISVDLLVPASAGLVTRAGPYFRSRSASPGDGIIGGTSAGYWVQLLSTGAIAIRGLNPYSVIASSATPASFNNTVFHTLQMAAQGARLQVSLDGQLLSFNQGGSSVTVVALPATSGSNDGTAGIAFSTEDNRGAAGGQRARNLVVSADRALDHP